MATKKTPVKKTPAKAPKKAQEEITSKMDRAVAVFKKMAGKPRKDVVKAFMEEVGLTKAGAATYYQIIKKKQN